MTTTHRLGAPTGVVPRVAAGAASGAAATLVMSWLMLAAVATGTAPMPKPIPVALVANLFGELAMPRLFAWGMLAHFGYGMVAGVIFALAGRFATWRWALAYAGLLWAVMGTVWLPYLGWGPFGAATDPAIVAATLALHLVYGATLGVLLPRVRRFGATATPNP